MRVTVKRKMAIFPEKPTQDSAARKLANSDIMTFSLPLAKEQQPWAKR
jgi:hypothetical protein